MDEVLKQELSYFRDMVMKMEDECNNPDLKLSISLPEEDDADSLRNDFDGIESETVGLSDIFNQIKDSLLQERYMDFSFISISGMAGIGKTTLAKKIYQDPEICNYFNCLLWVTVGLECGLRNIMLRILAQLNHDIHSTQMKEVEELGNELYINLKSRIFLIVLDDVWNEMAYKLKRYLPNKNHCRVLVATRLERKDDGFFLSNKHEMRFLNEEESWCLLRKKVFCEESCPSQLEKAGIKIAKNCDGLLLLIVTVAHLLSKAEKTLEYWNKVAKKKEKSIFFNTNDKISKILLRSYRYLPQKLRACFLYMGDFLAKCEMPASKLINFWTAEDLFDSDDKSPKLLAEEYIDGLAFNNVVLAHHNYSGGVKSCSLHSSFWHACVRQSWKEKFLHVITSFADSSKEGVRIQRRLCIYSNALLGMKEVYNSLQSISSAHSLICSGPNHQYPIPICFGLRLLKVLDILSVRFYKFPTEVLKLIHLRCLPLTYGGKVPASISKLWNIEYLIVHRHLNIKFPGDWSYLPVEIWNLQKLRHLQVMGSCLPYLRDAFLPNLLKLLDMSHHNCTKEIFERIPNLQKLGIQIELAHDVFDPLSCFDHLSHLKNFESLKCVISNPKPAKPQVIIPHIFTKTFPANLKKLSLSGFGYPWEYMRVIAKLPNLEVLKLRMYALRGPEWAKIPLEMGILVSVELVDSPLISEEISEKTKRGSDRGRYYFDVRVHSSWDDEELKA
ncbi:Apoptotic ATPase [Handroanthus impetiginosus]|uniref:Apoptotic ATPase n=1 Tax=Handroanthus impetiginosus TaxID=429701 RepID=A0A2G9GIU6_9LAMI|nr:Apoptotic ATPase [Handroanthus impetiginosus]